jgi:uncharacterized protein YcfJ
MKNPIPLHSGRPLALWAVAATMLGLGACAAPYPMNPPPVSQAQSPVYNPPSTSRRDYRRRDNERLYEAEITSVRAVMGQSEQRCWIEREAVAPQRTAPNVPGAIIGGVIGGILGHQVGGGTGKDIATAGGAVAGVIIGSNVGTDRYGNSVTTRDVQRCTSEPASRDPAYWDVSYQFRGVTHHVQMGSPPSGRSITVNENGEPRD